MVDIIIPIYNAFDVVKECIDSVIKNTNLSQNRLILIDDQSTDVRIFALLKKFRSVHPDKKIVVLQNENNLGFVSTVNKGMKYSESDVILLNSDTEVPSKWVENLHSCAYSQPDIATVTALSNNATLASVPIGLQKNSIPENMSFEEYANLIFRSSFREYPQIPTAHGFCMYIRRNVLDIVGYFDEKTFGKGYGEENDFSYRCMDYGFKHLLCDDVIVYHKESQSFDKKKDELIKQNMEKLKHRYPAYVENTSQWCSRFPIRNICDNVFFNIQFYNRKNVLFLIHDWSNVEKNVGGTTLHCKDLISSLRKYFNFHVLAPENGRFKLYSYFQDSERLLYLNQVPDNGMRSLYDPEYKKMVIDIIDGLGISFVHVHHMIGHYFDIIDVCRERNIRTAITLHDFYCLCPTVNLIYKSKYCLPLKDKDCASCLKEKKGIINNIIPVWQSNWRGFLLKFDNVLVPSNSTKTIIESNLKDIDCLVLEHGVKLERKIAKRLDSDDVLNVAFVGVMTEHKGSNVLKYLIDNTSNKKIQYHLFGDSLVEGLKQNKSNYIYHGRYSRENLPGLLEQNNIHLVCNLSIWPETYSYTLTETIASGIPVLSFDIGAVGERIKKYGFGWTLNETNEKCVLKKISSIFDDLDDYNDKIDRINSYAIKSVEEMIKSYVDLYDSSVLRQNSPESLKQLFMMNDLYKQFKVLDENSIYFNSKRWKLMKNLKVPSVVSTFVRLIRR